MALQPQCVGTTHILTLVVSLAWYGLYKIETIICPYLRQGRPDGSALSTLTNLSGKRLDLTPLTSLLFVPIFQPCLNKQKRLMSPSAFFIFRRKPYDFHIAVRFISHNVKSAFFCVEFNIFCLVTWRYQSEFFPALVMLLCKPHRCRSHSPALIFRNNAKTAYLIYSLFCFLTGYTAHGSAVTADNKLGIIPYRLLHAINSPAVCRACSTFPAGSPQCSL